MHIFLSVLLQLFIFQSPQTDASSNHYRIEVWQNGEQVEGNEGNIYQLKQEEFQLRFIGSIGYAFQLNASTNAYYHKTNFNLDEWDGRTVPEYQFNQERDLCVGKEFNHYFTHRPDETWNKFDSLIIDDKINTFTGIRSIRTFNFRNKKNYDMYEVDIQNMTRNLYITCIITDNKVITGAMRIKGIKHEELDRLKLTIKWK